MHYLIIAALIWGFSFGLIKTQLAGIDPSSIAWIRLTLASLLFVPFFRTKDLNGHIAGRLLLIGAIQYGLTYCLYLRALQGLRAYETALFVIFIPFCVTLIDSVYQRRANVFAWSMAAVAVLGAALIQYQTPRLSEVLGGFALMQLSNLCFAFGQVDYKYLRARHPELSDASIYLIPLVGGMLLSGAVMLTSGNMTSILKITQEGWLTLAYLGIFASGLSFYLWNTGATRAPVSTLAVMGVAKIPLAVACALLFFGEKTDLMRLLAGGALICAALILSYKREQKIALEKR